MTRSWSRNAASLLSHKCPRRKLRESPALPRARPQTPRPSVALPPRGRGPYLNVRRVFAQHPRHGSVPRPQIHARRPCVSCSSLQSGTETSACPRAGARTARAKAGGWGRGDSRGHALGAGQGSRPASQPVRLVPDSLTRLEGTLGCAGLCSLTSQGLAW